jgi:hypothetical protein
VQNIVICVNTDSVAYGGGVLDASMMRFIHFPSLVEDISKHTLADKRVQLRVEE